MSIDYDLLVHRLHRGACAFQSLRAHRRQRGAAPDPATVADARVPDPPPAPPPPVAFDPASDPRVTGSREPQAFMAVGGRVVPIFGDVNAVLGVPVASAGEGASLMGEPPPRPPRATPVPEEARPAPPPAPTISSSTLKLPPPTPPPRLGLVHGGNARPPAPEPVATETAATPTTGRTAPAVDAEAAVSTQEAAATLAAMFDTYAQQEAARLEKLHADHRAALAALLHQHREELHTRSEADAARTAELVRGVLQEHREELRARSDADTARAAEVLREVLAEHRTELASSRTEHLAQAPQREADQELRAALIEQAKLQREANEDVADHIANLTTIVADLGQTVGMLAVAAAQEARQSHLPNRPTFAAPPRAATPKAAALDASPVALPTAAAPAFAVSTAPSNAANSESTVSHRAARTPPSSPSLGSAPAATVPAITAPPLVEACAVKAQQQRPIRLARADEAAAQARVRQFADEDRDDDDLETGIDDDEPPRRPSLPPITNIDSPIPRERDHG